ncbi:MAG: putative ATP-dependent RNA helicase ucp12 [Ramalina farinacea]|uniref:RNA helicase n=1 Tax=Ramalina farinacea TaxID=258253 RepID=A0AA43QN14_9LECA|nr:putative ATP-dependent RNA helicase ucp12 [Ramalina farinacea]
MPKKGGRGGKSPFTHDEGDHIIFGDAKSSKKKEVAKPEASNNGTKQAANGTEEAAKRADTRALIGGASWTGKLPVNMLSEHCQKQKWFKPDYTMKNADGSFSSTVILRAKNPKTQETITLPPFMLPPEMKHLALQPSAVEARHFAATYALFRVCSMKNIHMMLPPVYRDLWKKEFQELKAVDVKEGRGWMYEADPFAARQERDQVKAVMAKKREERDKRMAKEAEEPIISLSSGGVVSHVSRNNLMKGWTKVPKVDMGKRMRADVEDLIRRHAVWNPYGIDLTHDERTTIIQELSSLGFRQRHVEEAVQECGDREEALEWLLIHVPEDDLPKWALPEGYTAGVSMASSNLKREATIKRLAEGGYGLELCARLLDECEGHQALAAEVLQDLLVGHDDSSVASMDGKLGGINGSESLSVWDEEVLTLEAIYGPRFRSVGEDIVELQLEIPTIQEIILHFRRSQKYPLRPPILAVLGKGLPSHMRLSAIRQSIHHAASSFLGDPMIFNLVEWLEAELPRIIDNPGSLKSVAAATSGYQSKDIDTHTPKKSWTRRRPAAIQTRAGTSESMNMLRLFNQRHETAQQQRMLAARASLPAWKLQDAILAAVNDHQVTIIAGETGSGKSTQAVQFILDDMIRRQAGATVNIVCTQPRRISALGLADRVSAERCSTVGDEVGYAIRGESKQSRNTKINFVTTGVLLRKLQTSGGSKDDLVASLADVSHVVVDEVHERGLDTDFLLVLLKGVLKIRKDLKVILMSATLDADVFKQYFGGNVALVEIEGRTYPVQDHYLDDVIRMTGFQAGRSSNRRTDDTEDDPDPSLSSTIQNIGMQINYDLIRATVEAIDMDLGTVIDGGILIFLPGTLEINRALNALRDLSDIHALPLHASLTPAEQKRVFPPAPRGKRKVIAATNVAETSITIEDIVAVIDLGKVKETSFDPSNNMVKLQEVWASRAACKQRRGRAGRVRDGECYKLYTRNAEAKMAERPEPEICRVPLEQLCLSVRAMGVTDIPSFLASALTPPQNSAVEGAIGLLHRMGALDGDHLTSLGRHLSMIPADLRCGKLLIHGTLFDCLEPCLTIASILTARPPFLSPQAKRDEAKAARTAFGPGQGDLLCDLRAYEGYASLKAEHTPYREIKSWCDNNFLSQQTLSDIATNRAQYLLSLKEIGFLPPSYTSPSQSNTTSPALLRALIASAFNPQIARIAFPDKKYAPSVSGAVELDPEARTIKFFTESPVLITPSSSTTGNRPPNPGPHSAATQQHPPSNRVFLHPSSTLFPPGSTPPQFAPPNPNYLSYFSALSTSKHFIRECSPLNAYALLLFGGKVEMDTAGRGLLVDGWLKVRAHPRIGALVGRLRGMLEGVLGGWVDEGDVGGREGMRREVVRVVGRLVEMDGMDA